MHQISMKVKEVSTEDVKGGMRKKKKKKVKILLSDVTQTFKARVG